jgi:hypothetical protein
MPGRFARLPYPAALWRVLYRLAAGAIILFWLVMTGLLVRTECFPGTSDLLPVPPGRLFTLMFLHEQASDLVLFRDQERLGDLHLQPHRFPPSAGPARNLLTLNGSTILNLPGLETRHLTFRANLEIDDQSAVRHFEFTATVSVLTPNTLGRSGTLPPKPAPNLVIVLDGEPLLNHYHYAMRQGEALLAEQAGSPAELLDQPELRDLGLNPALLSGLARQQGASTQVTARRGVWPGKGKVEDIETYDVTIRQADTVAATVQLSQLGQVLAIKTAAGYSLLDESLAP